MKKSNRIRTKLTQHGDGAFLNWITNNPQQAAGAFNLAGGAIGAIDSMAGSNGSSDLGSAMSNALSWGGMGLSVGGPVGGAIGGVVGAGVGLFQNMQQRRAAEEADRKAKEAAFKQSQNIRRNFDSQTKGMFSPMGNEVGGMYAKGGLTTPQYLAEDGEVIQHNPYDKPKTDKYGSLNQLASDFSKIKGAKHSSQSQGVGMSGGERIYSDQLKPAKRIAKLFLQNI